MHSRQHTAIVTDFDTKWFKSGKFELRPIGELQHLANAIRRHYRIERPLKVVAGDGLRSNGACRVSFQMGSRIELSRTMRNYLILTHEMAHWLGPRDKIAHGPAFRRRYATLLVKLGLLTKDETAELLP